MKTLKHILSILSSLILLTACKDPISPPTTESIDLNWTVMIWMDADNNLEEAGMGDFNEIEEGLGYAQNQDPDIMDKLAVIVQLDRVDAYDTGLYGSTSDWTETRRYRAQPDSPYSSGLTSTELENLGEVNMGDAEELKDFIEFCKETYPAEHYALILWNHGSGVRSIDLESTGQMISRGIASDDTDDDIIYTGEINQILTDAEDVDIIGFDACVMGTLEIAYEFRPATGKFGADFMAASVANEQFDGWEYDKIFRRFGGTGQDSEGDTLYDADDLSPQQFVEIITKEYGDAFDDSYNTSETMASLDLRTLTSTIEAENAKLALDSLAASLAVNDRKDAFEALRGSGSNVNSLEYFDESSSSEWYAWPHFDLYDLADRVKNDTANFGTETTLAENLQTALDNLILTSYGGPSYDAASYSEIFEVGKNGLGIFFPDGDGLYGENSDDYYYGYQWWYTNLDTTLYGSNYSYGMIDFCETDDDGTVENWKELMEFWYDDGTNYTDDTY